MINIDPAVPDPSDRTGAAVGPSRGVRRASRAVLSVIGEQEGDGWPLGWLGLGAGLAGALLAEATDGRHEVVALPWCEDRAYGLLRPAVARERWVRVVSRLSIACATDAMVFTALVDADQGVRRWQALTVDAWPVLLTDSDGRNPRPWLLREDCVYHLDYDVEHGWQVWAQTEDAGTISGVTPTSG